MSDPQLLNAGQSPFGWHRYQSFMQCPRKYYLSYIEKRPRETSAPLILGSLVHTGLAHHYGRMRLRQQGKDEAVLYEPIAAMQKQAELEGDEWLPHIEQCTNVLNAYREDAQVKKWESDLEILYVEEVYKLQIDDAPMTLRADLVVRVKSENKIYIVDHKTTAAYRKAAVDGYRVSGQFVAFQFAGEQAHGKEFGGLLLNILQHGGKRKGKIAFDRQFLRTGKGHYDAFLSSALFYFSLLKSMEGKEGKYYPRTSTEFTCMHKYGKCPFYDICLHE